MANALFTGCATALITPFHQGEVDYKTLQRLVDFQLENGIDGIVACGTTGEPSTMTAQEWESVLSLIVKTVHGRVPVIAGTGGNNTRDVIEKARRARELGADAQLCVTPYYNKTTQAGLIAHYTAVARDGALPVIVYNVPSRTGLNLLPDTLNILADEENIIAMKEASASMIQVMNMVRLCGDRMAFYSGTDEITVPVRSVGGVGTISVLSNLAPKVMRDMTHLPLDEAIRLNLQYLPLITALFSEVSPIPVKAAAEMMGLCESEVRLPLTAASEKTKELLKAELQKVGLLC
ncbi:MAG: 4-hydroxy-tetrahydrodipicolinate synthase [Clostridia bacterium]|nr:4-hydroxy-tetrahydrodipicolinate synthase [Clostridia bacterium]